MVRVGLTQRVETIVERQERRDCLDQAWVTLLLECGLFPVPVPNCVQDIPQAVGELGLDGVILTGGNDICGLPGATSCAPERDRLETELLKHCSKSELPVLGVCRGMQMLVVYHGGELVPVSGHIGSRHELKVIKQSRLPLLTGELVNSYHGFGVLPENTGEGLEVLATSADGLVEAVAHNKHKQFGIMWHPERAPQNEMNVELIKSVFGGGN